MFDSHCHLTDSRFDKDRLDVISSALQGGITSMVTIASNFQDTHAAAEIAAGHDGIWSTAGIHPHEVSQAQDDDLNKIRDFAMTHPEVVAIGETGLDFFYDNSPRKLQQKWFDKQAELACDIGLPLVIHSREAEEETISVLRNAPSSSRMVLHCFTGSMQLLEVGLEAGCYFSFSGLISFAKFDAQQAVRAVPGDLILAETDSPYLAPVPYRGQRNEPVFVTEVIKAMANIRGESVEHMAESTTTNAKRFYALGL